MAKISSLNPSHLASTNGIEFDEKLKQEIENLYPNIGASEEIFERYTIQQLQLQSKKENMIHSRKILYQTYMYVSSECNTGIIQD